MALVVISTRQVAAPPDANAVEVLGWLELPWDDARFLIVTQLNEGTVPTSANSDLFLPNALRQNLGLDDNSRRYARDAYALHALTCSRQKLVVIVASRNAEGYPILPSRLLFAASDEVRAGRCLRFFSEHGTSEQSEEMADAVLEGQGAVEVEADGGGPLPAGERPQLLSVPFPLTEVEVDSFRVTDFRAYLACPYRFYLEKVLRLSEVIKQKNELDGGAFGSLLHQVLEAFGKSNVRDAELPHKIEEFLLEAMRELFTEQYGDRIRPAVKIQQSQMKLRLKEFAQRQAAWRQAGWRIERTEVESTTLNTPWRSEFPSVSLRGRIDRIDRHESTNEYAILDYKSSDKVRSPRDVHHKEGKPPVLNMEKWRDLQLPLYRHLVSELNIQGKASLGFILLPRDLDAVGFVMADWSDAELAIADQVANRVVRNVRSRVFWPPIVHKDARSFNASIERICQIGVFDRRLGESPSDMDPRLISSTDR